jgi:hypothetical protein
MKNNQSTAFIAANSAARALPGARGLHKALRADREGYYSYAITQTGWEDLGYQRSAAGWGRRPWWKRMLGI